MEGIRPQSRRLHIARRLLLAAGLVLAACSSDHLGPVVVAFVDVRPGTGTVVVGTQLKLTATPRSASGAALVGRPITWLTSAPGLATVDTTGLVRGVEARSRAVESKTVSVNTVESSRH